MYGSAKKRFPCETKGQRRVTLFLLLVRIPQWSQRDLHGSTQGLSKYEYTTRMKSNNFNRSAKLSHQGIRLVGTPCQIEMKKMVTARL